MLSSAVGRSVMPAVKHRAGNDVFEWTQGPVQIGMHEGGMGDGEGTQEYQHVWGNSGEQQHDISSDAAEKYVDRVEPRCRNPIQVRGGVVHRVVFPQCAAMKGAMDPVHHEIGAHEKDRGLQPKRQLRKRAMPVVIELDQALGTGDAENRPQLQEPKARCASSAQTTGSGTNSRGR